MVGGVLSQGTKKIKKDSHMNGLCVYYVFILVVYQIQYLPKSEATYETRPSDWHRSINYSKLTCSV